MVSLSNHAGQMCIYNQRLGTTHGMYFLCQPDKESTKENAPRAKRPSACPDTPSGARNHPDMESLLNKKSPHRRGFFYS